MQPATTAPYIYPQHWPQCPQIAPSKPNLNKSKHLLLKRSFIHIEYSPWAVTADPTAPATGPRPAPATTTALARAAEYVPYFL